MFGLLFSGCIQTPQNGEDANKPLVVDQNQPVVSVGNDKPLSTGSDDQKILTRLVGIELKKVV